MTNRLAYTYAEAAETCGVSKDVIRGAVRRGDLVAHYPTARPVIFADDLRDWLTSTPTETPSEQKEAS